MFIVGVTEMARRTGLVSQIWRNIKYTLALSRAQENIAGRDVDGNTFYERLADPSKGFKPLRRVESADGDTWNAPTVPVEWDAWLRFKRESAPSEEEIQRNHEIKLRTKQRAMERDKAQRERIDEMEPKLKESDSQKKSFPVYDDYENHPGQFAKEKTKQK